MGTAQLVTTRLPKNLMLGPCAMNCAGPLQQQERRTGRAAAVARRLILLKRLLRHLQQLQGVSGDTEFDAVDSCCSLRTEAVQQKSGKGSHSYNHNHNHSPTHHHSNNHRLRHPTATPRLP